MHTAQLSVVLGQAHQDTLTFIVFISHSTASTLLMYWLILWHFFCCFLARFWDIGGKTSQIVLLSIQYALVEFLRALLWRSPSCSHLPVVHTRNVCARVRMCAPV